MNPFSIIILVYIFLLKWWIRNTLSFWRVSISWSFPGSWILFSIFTSHIFLAWSFGIVYRFYWKIISHTIILFFTILILVYWGLFGFMLTFILLAAFIVIVDLFELFIHSDHSVVRMMVVNCDAFFVIWSRHDFYSIFSDHSIAQSFQ